MLSVMEWQLLSLNKILPQRVSPKPWVALRAPLAKVEEKPASTNIQKGRELLSDRIRVCFFTLRKRSVQGVGVRLGCSVQTCPVINVWFLWVADNPALKLLQFFHFEVGFNGVFFQVLEGILFFLPPLPFQKYESKYLEELLFKRCIVSPVKVCGCLSVSWVPRVPVRRGGGVPGPELLCLWCWPAPRSCWNQHLPPLPLSGLTVILTTQWIKCVLYS